MLKKLFLGGFFLGFFLCGEFNVHLILIRFF